MLDNEKNEDFQNNTTDDLADDLVDENSSFEEEAPKSKKSRIVKEIRSWIITILGAVIFAFLITNFIIVNAVVPTESMEDTIKVGDRLIAFRLSYAFDDPERFDVAVFKYPDDEDVLYIKRIIGLPGEKVTIKQDATGKTNVYINDSKTPIDDSFIREPMELIGKIDGMYVQGKELTYTVPDNCYFMLGDNRNNSKDSRFWDKTFVQKDKILGKALFKYYPSISWIDDKD